LLAVVPQLDGLAARLDAPGTAFLDVGVGAARLAAAGLRDVRALPRETWPAGWLVIGRRPPGRAHRGSASGAGG
jgi:hypothetical protein